MDKEELLKNSYKENQKIADTCLSELPSKLQSRTWNDEDVSKEGKDIIFRVSVRDIKELQKILCRFFNFYFHGVVRAEDRLSTILANVIANARTFENNFWPSYVVFDESSFSFKQNLSDTKDLLQDTIEPLDNLVFSNADQTAAEKVAYNELTTEYTIDEGQKFKNFIDVEIRNINPSMEETNETIRLKRLASFLALTLWRSATKNKYQLNKAFLEKQYRSDLETVAGWSKELPFYPPCSQCIEACVETLPNSLSTKKIFVLLVSEYIKCTTSSYYDEPNKIKFLCTSLLTPTAKHGLGILQLLERASLVIDLKWKELLKMTYLNVTKDSWTIITNFFRDYACQGKIQYGYNWARIINESYLRGYTPEDHLALTGILLGIIEQVEYIDMWDIEWAEEHKDELREMRVYGKVLYDLVKAKPALHVWGFEESASILKITRGILATQQAEKKQTDVTTDAIMHRNYY